MLKRKKNPRLSGYDYSSDGYYYITNNTDYSKPFIKDKVKEKVKSELFDLEKRFSGVSVYYYSLMPTHVHVILILDDCQTSIPEIWRVFKSKSTVAAKKVRFEERRLWQRNYFEHVIRNEVALRKIVEYIRDNPFKEELPWREIYGDRIPSLEI